LTESEIAELRDAIEKANRRSMTGHTVFVECVDGPLAGTRMRFLASNVHTGAIVGWCHLQPGGPAVTNYKNQGEAGWCFDGFYLPGQRESGGV